MPDATPARAPRGPEGPGRAVLSAGRRTMAAELVYTVDGQGRVLAVREATTPAPHDDAPHAARPPVAVVSLVAPLAWEPVQRLRAWGAREGMTAAELLDTCRAATRPTTTRRRRSKR